MPVIDVPGIGQVYADGFAEEQTMQRILAALQGRDDVASVATAKTNAQLGVFGTTLGRTGASVQDSGQRASAGLNTVGPAARQLSRDLSVSARSFNQSFASASQAPFAFANSLVQTAANLSKDSKIFTTVLGAAAGAAITDLLGKDGTFAKLMGAGLGGLAGAVAGDAVVAGTAAIAGFLFEKLNATTDAFFKVQNSGAILGGSLIELRVNAHASNLTMAEFSNVMAKNSEAMASFGGQTLRGAREFARANSRLTQLHGTELLQMGVSFEDMGMATAEMMENFGRSGYSIEQAGIQTREFAQATRNQITQQKIMAALTGRSIEQQKEAERQQRKDAIVQASLARFQPEQRAEMERLIAAFPHLREAILDQAVFGTATSAEALRQFSAFPTAMEGITGAVDKAKAGVGGAADAFIASARDSEAIRSEQLAAADTLATLGRFTSNAFVKTIQESYVPMQDLMVKSIQKTVLDVTGDMAKIGTSANAATKAVIESIEANRRVGMSLSNLATGLLSQSDGLVSVIASSMNKVADVTNSFARSVGIPRQSTNVGAYNTEVGINAYGDGDVGTGTTTTTPAPGSVTNQNGAITMAPGPIVTSSPDVVDAVNNLAKQNRRVADRLDAMQGAIAP